MRMNTQSNIKLTLYCINYYLYIHKIILLYSSGQVAKIKQLTGHNINVHNIKESIWKWMSQLFSTILYL